MKYSRIRGFGLVEVLVSAAIMGGALLIAFDLIEHSLRVSGEATAEPGNPHTIAAEMAIRRDIQAAEYLPGVGATSRGELTLGLQDGRIVVWRRERGALVRAETNSKLETAESRPLAKRVTGWRWKVVAPNLIEVRFEVAASPQATGLRQTGPPDSSFRAETRVVCASPRGARGEGTW